MHLAFRLRSFTLRGMRRLFPIFPALCASLLAFCNPAIAQVLVNDPFTVSANSVDVNFQLTTRQTGQLAPITYSEGFQGDFSQVGNPEVPNGLLLAARTAGDRAAVSLNHNFTEVPGPGNTMTIEFDVNPVLILPGMNKTQSSWIMLTFGGVARNVYPESVDGVGVLLHGNGAFELYNNKVVVATGTYALEDDLYHHIRVVISDPTDGNPFNGNSPATVQVYADSNATPFTTYSRTGGFSSNYISIAAQGEGSGGDNVVRHGVDNLKVSINDLTAPTIAAPAGGFTPRAFVTGAAGTVPLPDYRASAIVSDNVAVTSVTQSPVAGTALQAGTRSVTMTARDAAGNSKSISFTVSIADGTNPQISAPADGFTPLTISTAEDGSAALPDYTGQAVATDNVGVISITQSPEPGSAQAAGSTQVVLTASDPDGNTATTTFDVTVLDATKPQVNAPFPSFTPLALTTGATGTIPLPDYTAQAVTSDNVAVTSVTQDPPAGSLRVAGTTTVTITAMDEAGNENNLSFEVAVADGTAPTIAAPGGGFAPTVIQVGADGTAALPNYTGLAVTSDNVAVTSVTQAPAIGTAFPPGTRAVVLTAQDAAGNTSSITFNVEFIDVTKPTIEAPAEQFTPLTIVTGEDGTALLPDYTGQAVTTDNVGIASVTQSPIFDSPQVVGTTKVIVTATDAAGNESSTSFDVTVADGTKPAIAAPQTNFTPLTLVTGLTGSAPLPDYTAQPVTSDNVAVTEVTQSPEPGSARVFGTTAVTLTAHDAAGNTRDFTFDVAVQDGTNPTIAAPGDGFAPLALTTGVDGTVTLPDYTSQPGTTDNVAVTEVTQSPVAGSARVAGVTTVTLTAHDAAGNTIATSFEVAVADGTKPDIAAPGSGFTPVTIVAGDDGTAPLPDYTTQAVTSDNVAVTSVTQLPAPGDVRLFGKTVVTLTVHDDAGNTRDLTFNVFVTLDAPLVNTLAGIGGAVPGHGIDPAIPDDAKFTSVGLPVVDDARRVAFLAKWKGSSGTGVGVFAGEPLALLAKVGGDAPGLSGVQFKTLQDPLISPDGTVAFGATLKGQGVKAGNDFSVWASAEAAPALLLREGLQVPGAPAGTLLKSVSGLSLRNGELLAVSKLAVVRGIVTAADDSALLSVNANGGKILLREGTPVDLQDGNGASAIKKLETLLPAPGSPAHGRWHTEGGAIARVTLADKRLVIVQRLADDTLLPRLAVGSPALAGAASWKVLGLPAVEPGGDAVVIKGQLKAVAGQLPAVTAKNDAVLALDPGNATGFTIFAREGTAPADAGGATYASFLDPVVNVNQDVLFGATLAGSGVTAKNKTALFWGNADAPLLLARSGAAAPDTVGNLTGALWSKFTSAALPSGPNAGPVFTAKLVGPGVTAKTNVGLWAVDSTGLLRQLLRTGDLIDGKAVTGIHALTNATGSLGASRGFNERGTVITRVSFAKGAQAILRLDIPEGRVRATTEAE
jgi:hypothetical protein